MDKEKLKDKLTRVKQRELSVLFVEDNDTIRQVIGNSLQLAFKHYDLAANGKDALIMLKRHQYDLVITDMNMPESDGVDLIRNIRAFCKVFPIIITTAHGEFTEIYEESPNIYVIEKPYSIYDIIDAVDALETNGKIIVEDNVYDKLEESYIEAKKVLDMLNEAFKGKKI